MSVSALNIRLISLRRWPHSAKASVHADSLADEPGENDMQALRPRLGPYLVQLRDHLDTTTLGATLGLMISECRAEIRKQRDLIALLRFDGQDTRAPVARLEELMALEESLLAAQERASIAADLEKPASEALPAEATVVPLRRC